MALMWSRATVEALESRRLYSSVHHANLSSSLPTLPLPPDQVTSMASIRRPQPRAGAATGALAPHQVHVIPAAASLAGRIVRQPAHPIFIAGPRGGRGKVQVLLINVGSIPVRGPVTIQLFISPAVAFQAGSPPIGAVVVHNASLKVGNPKLVAVPFRIPRHTPVGTYFLFASIQQGNGQAELVMSPTPLQVTDRPRVIVVGNPHHHRYFFEENGDLIPYADSGSAFGIFSDGFDTSGTDNPLTDTSGDNAPTPEPTTGPTTEPTTAPTTDPNGQDTGAGGDTSGGSDTNGGGDTSGSGDTSGGDFGTDGAAP